MMRLKLTHISFPALAVTITVLGAAATNAPAANIAYENEVLDQSPFSFHRFNETSGTTANDTSSNNRDGNYNGGPTLGLTGAGSDSDNAAGFDGTDDAMAIPNSDAASLGSQLDQVTFESVFRTSVTSSQRLFGALNSGSNTAA